MEHPPSPAKDQALPRRKRDISLTVIGVAAFLCGATSSVKFGVVGQVYLAELLLVPFALLVVMTRGDGGVSRTRMFSLFLAAGLLTLAGYMISDVLAGTAPWQYLRGWGRVIFVVSDSLMLMLLVGNRRQNIWWYVLGYGIGGVAYLYAHHVPFHQWKLGYGGNVVMIVIALVPFLGRRRGYAALAIFGLLNIILDYRNVGAACIISAAALWARAGDPMAALRQAGHYAKFIVLSLAGVAILAAALVITRGEHAQRREDSDIGRAAGITVALRAIAASPFIGYGSWTVDPKYAQQIQEIVEKKGVQLHNAKAGPATIFRPHSEVLQAWVEGGLLGACFFLVLIYQIIKCGIWVAMRRPLDTFSPMYMYLLVVGFWNALASPFGGDQRLMIALAVAVIATRALDEQIASVGADDRSEAPLRNHGPTNPVERRGDRGVSRRAPRARILSPRRRP